LELPRLTDHFTLGPELGRGGFGVVYRGEAREGGAPVAIKVLLERPDEVTQGRMAREAQALRGLEHPRLATFLGLFRDPAGTVAMVYEYVEGRPMEEVLRERLPGPDRGLRWCRDLAAALDALHGAGLVHRDVKPGNLIVGPDEHVTLLDFGLLRGVEAGDTVTQHGLVVGTPEFMAPELLRGERPSPACDVYAFGCLVHLLAAGTLPFPEDSPGALVDAHLRREPPAFPGWAGPARAALAKDPTQRPASAGDLVRRLDTQQPSAATVRVEAAREAKLAPATPKASTPRARLPVAPFLASLVLAAGLGVWISRTGEPPAPSSAPTRAPSPSPSPRARRLPSDHVRVMPLRSDTPLELPASHPVQLSSGEVVISTPSNRLAILDPRTGDVRLGPPLHPALPAEVRPPLQLLPGPDGRAWVFHTPGGWNSDATRVFSLEEPSRPAARKPENIARGAREFDIAEDLGGGLWVLPAPAPAHPPDAPGTLWVSRDGERPRPVPLPELGTARRLVAQARTPEGGMVLQIGDLGHAGGRSRTTILEIGPDDRIRWTLTVPSPGLDQARLALAPEGVYLIHDSRLVLLEREGIHGERTTSAFRPISEKIPELARQSPTQCPGRLHRSRHGVELWTLPTNVGLGYSRGAFQWLRFSAPPGEVPDALTSRTEHPLKDGLVVRDGTCGVRQLKETGDPDRPLLEMMIENTASHLVVPDLARGEISWEVTLETAEDGHPLQVRSRLGLFPMPGREGRWLVVAATTRVGHAVFLERYFAPGGLLTRR
jgi:serine/threonine protein kinase